MTAGAGNDPIMTVAEAKEVDLSDGKPSYFSTKATISFVRHETFSYPACPKEGCNKKLVFTGQSWRCEKDNENFEAPVHRQVGGQPGHDLLLISNSQIHPVYERDRLDGIDVDYAVR